MTPLYKQIIDIKTCQADEHELIGSRTNQIIIFKLSYPHFSSEINSDQIEAKLITTKRNWKTKEKFKN